MSAGGGVAVILMMLVITIDVLGRRYFGSPLRGAYETVEDFLMVGLVWFCLPAIQRAGGNVRVGIVVERLLPAARDRLTAAPNALMTVALGALGWAALERGLRLWGETTYNTVIPLPLGLSWVLMGFGLVVTAFQILASLLLSVTSTEQPSAPPAPRRDQ